MPNLIDATTLENTDSWVRWVAKNRARRAVPMKSNRPRKKKVRFTEPIRTIVGGCSNRLGRGATSGGRSDQDQYQCPARHRMLREGLGNLTDSPQRTSKCHGRCSISAASSSLLEVLVPAGAGDEPRRSISSVSGQSYTTSSVRCPASSL